MEYADMTRAMLYLALIAYSPHDIHLVSCEPDVRIGTLLVTHYRCDDGSLKPTEY